MSKQWFISLQRYPLFMNLRDCRALQKFAGMFVHRASFRSPEDYWRGKDLCHRRYSRAELHQRFLISSGSVAVVHQRRSSKLNCFTEKVCFSSSCIMSVLVHVVGNILNLGNVSPHLFFMRVHLLLLLKLTQYCSSTF